jgi:hypothetical protein
MLAHGWVLDRVASPRYEGGAMSAWIRLPPLWNAARTLGSAS